MADLIIKGMEMPKDGRITIQIGADGAVYFVEKCTIMAEKYEKSSHAVPLPEGHGRLGDLDELETTVIDAIEKGFNAEDVLLDIHFAPTMVGAEGGSDDA